MNGAYNLDVEAVLALLKSDRHRGLDSADASLRMGQHGANEIETPHRVSVWAIVIEQFKNILILILLVAVILSALFGHNLEAITITVILLFSVVLGVVQEYRAERAIDALRKMAAPRATVIRDGEELDIPARELVPGDIILVRAGDRIPADLRLIEAINLQIEEAALTGESAPVEKNTQAVIGHEAAVGDRKCMAYAGTICTYGRGRGVVAATGMQTEFGRIALMLQTVETGKTPLQENLDKVGARLGSRRHGRCAARGRPRCVSRTATPGDADLRHCSCRGCSS